MGTQLPVVYWDMCLAHIKADPAANGVFHIDHVLNNVKKISHVHCSKAWRDTMPRTGGVVSNQLNFGTGAGCEHPDFGKLTAHIKWSDAEVAYIRQWKEQMGTQLPVVYWDMCLAHIKADPRALRIFHAQHLLNRKNMRLVLNSLAWRSAIPRVGTEQVPSRSGPGCEHPDFGEKPDCTRWSEGEVAYVRQWMDQFNGKLPAKMWIRCLTHLLSDPAAVRIFHKLHTMDSYCLCSIQNSAAWQSGRSTPNQTLSRLPTAATTATATTAARVAIPTHALIDYALLEQTFPVHQAPSSSFTAGPSIPSIPTIPTTPTTPTTPGPRNHAALEQVSGPATDVHQAPSSFLSAPTVPDHAASVQGSSPASNAHRRKRACPTVDQLPADPVADAQASLVSRLKRACTVPPAHQALPLSSFSTSASASASASAFVAAASRPTAAEEEEVPRAVRARPGCRHPDYIFRGSVRWSEAEVAYMKRWRDRFSDEIICPEHWIACLAHLRTDNAAMQIFHKLHMQDVNSLRSVTQYCAWW
jgi:hypothetical protein